MITLRLREFDFDDWNEVDVMGMSEEDISSIILSWAVGRGWEVEIFTAEGEWGGAENGA